MNKDKELKKILKISMIKMEFITGIALKEFEILKEKEGKENSLNFLIRS